MINPKEIISKDEIISAMIQEKVKMNHYYVTSQFPNWDLAAKRYSNLALLLKKGKRYG